MRSHQGAEGKEPRPGAAPEASTAARAGRLDSPSAILALQQTIGNAAVVRALQRPGSPSGGVLARKNGGDGGEESDLGLAALFEEEREPEVEEDPWAEDPLADQPPDWPTTPPQLAEVEEERRPGWADQAVRPAASLEEQRLRATGDIEPLDRRRRSERRQENERRHEANLERKREREKRRAEVQEKWAPARAKPAKKAPDEQEKWLAGRDARIQRREEELRISAAKEEAAALLKDLQRFDRKSGFKAKLQEVIDAPAEPNPEARAALESTMKFIRNGTRDVIKAGRERLEKLTTALTEQRNRCSADPVKKYNIVKDTLKAATDAVDQVDPDAQKLIDSLKKAIDDVGKVEDAVADVQGRKSWLTHADRPRTVQESGTGLEGKIERRFATPEPAKLAEDLRKTAVGGVKAAADADLWPLINPDSGKTDLPAARTKLKDMLDGGAITKGELARKYRSSYDHGGDFSVEWSLTGFDRIVIHAHCKADGTAKSGNAVHWKIRGEKLVGAAAVGHATSHPMPAGYGGDKLMDPARNRDAEFTE